MAGLAERAVQTFKTGLKKSSPGDLERRLASFLFHYRTTPHSTTGTSPAKLLMGRCLRNHLDILRPDIGCRVRAKQAQQKQGHDQMSQSRQFDLDDRVMVRNYASGPKWLPGIISSTHGGLHFGVQLEDGRGVRRHLDQIRGRLEVPGVLPQDGDTEELEFDFEFEPETFPDVPGAPQPQPAEG